MIAFSVLWLFNQIGKKKNQKRLTLYNKVKFGTID